MRNGAFLVLPLLASLALSAGCAPSDAETRERDPGDFDLEELVTVSSFVDGATPAWSPDGATLAIVGQGQLWTVSSDGGEPQSVPVENPQSPKYSPDGSWIAFVANHRWGPEIWLWSIDEQVARPLTELGALEIGSFSWAPDGKRIAFHANRSGTLDIFTVEVLDGAVRRLTSDPLYDVNPTWTPDSRQIVFARMDDRWVDHDILVIDADGGEPRLVIREEDFFDYRRGVEFGPAQVSPDGDMILFRSVRNGYINHWLVPVEGGEPRPVWAEEADQPGRPPPFRGYARWSPDGQSVAFTSGLNGTHVLRVAPIDGGEARTLVDPGIGSVGNLAWSPDGTRISYTLDSPVTPGDLWVVDVESGETQRIISSVPETGLEEALFVPEKVFYESTDNLTIPALLYRPPPSAGEGPFPAIVWIHGGPTSQFDDSWLQNWEAQYLVKHGYVVLMPNIRGSSGYGTEFEGLNYGCWGHCDLEDVVAGVEYLKTLPYVDSENFGITGSSYGGYMSMAAATFAPGVFRASVPTQSAYVDRVGLLETYDLAGLNLMRYELGEPDEELYRSVSPIYFVDRVETPMLVVGGTSDGIANQQMRSFVQALERHYKPVWHLEYAGAVGSAENRLEWMPEVLEFLDVHLRGREVLPSPAEAPF